MCEIEGENIAGKMKCDKALRDVQGNKEKVDVILIGGPMNRLVTHGKAVERGLGGEREVKVKQKDNVEEEKWRVTYYMTRAGHRSL
jgi:hypothetical protein